jgi:hypothetical protein
MSQLPGHDRESGSVSQELLSYLLWAVEFLGLAEELDLFRPDSEALERFRDRIGRASQRFLTAGRIGVLEIGPDVVLRQPELYFRTEEKELAAAGQAAAFARMLAAIILAISGDFDGHKWLAAMLVTDQMNRKLTIARFLGLLTDGQVGWMGTELPSRSQALNWAKQIATRDISVRSRLFELAETRSR